MHRTPDAVTRLDHANRGRVPAGFTRLMTVEPVVQRMRASAMTPTGAVTVRDRFDTRDGSAALQSSLGR